MFLLFLQMESMFNKLTSEYGSKNTSWKTPCDFSSLPSSPTATATKTIQQSRHAENESSKTEVDKNTDEEEEEEKRLKEQVQGIFYSCVKCSVKNS